MKKNLYIQPKTELLQTTLSTIICVSVVLEPQDGITSEAPARGLRGLKYL